MLLLKKYNPAAYHLISILMDHNDNLDESTVEKRNKIVDFIRINCALAKDFEPEEIHHILGILSVNSFVVHDGGEDEVNTDLIGTLIILLLSTTKQGLFLSTFPDTSDGQKSGFLS